MVCLLAADFVVHADGQAVPDVDQADQIRQINDFLVIEVSLEFMQLRLLVFQILDKGHLLSPAQRGLLLLGEQGGFFPRI